MPCMAQSRGLGHCSLHKVYPDPIAETYLDAKYQRYTSEEMDDIGNLCTSISNIVDRPKLSP